MSATARDARNRALKVALAKAAAVVNARLLVAYSDETKAAISKRITDAKKALVAPLAEYKAMGGKYSLGFLDTPGPGGKTLGTQGSAGGKNMILGIVAAGALFVLAWVVWIIKIILEGLVIGAILAGSPEGELREDIEELKAEEARLKADLRRLRGEVQDPALLAEIDAALVR